jgi:hypothetical protein
MPNAIKLPRNITKIFVGGGTAKVAAREYLVARVTLLSYYNRRAYSTSIEVKALSVVRLEHINWFVENIPDSEFCGESAFYLGAADDDYKPLTASWAEQISRSNNLQRRVNAYMLHAFNKDSRLPLP